MAKSQCIFIFLFMVAAFPAFSQQNPSNSDLVQIEPPVYHFGKIPDSRPVEGVFIIKNTSNQLLKILRVHTTCGCMVSQIDKKEIYPRETSTLKIAFDPRGRAGYSRWQIDVLTNLAESSFNPAFDMTVLKEAMVSENSLSFGEFRQGALVQRKVWVSPRFYPGFKIHKVSVEAPLPQAYFTIKEKSEVYAGFYPEPRQAHCVVLTTRKDIPVGRLSGKLVIETDIPGNQKIGIPIWAKVVSNEIVADRDYVVLGMVEKGQSVSKTVVLYHIDGRAFKINGARTSLSCIEATWQPLGTPHHYEVKITAKAKGLTGMGEFRGELVLTTSNERQPEVKILVQGFIKP